MPQLTGPYRKPTRLEAVAYWVLVAAILGLPVGIAIALALEVRT